MTDKEPEPRTVVVEREFAHPPEKVWRALTQPHLIAEWLMQNDFAPVVGRQFNFSADWGAVACEVQAVEAGRALAYSWAAHGLESVVTWTLLPTGKGTLLRMEQIGFKPDQDQAFNGARLGWRTFFANLETVLADSIERTSEI